MQRDPRPAQRPIRLKRRFVQVKFAAVVIRTTRHSAGDDARFALRELKGHWDPDTPVLVGMEPAAALDLLPPDTEGLMLVLRSAFITLDPHCLGRLAAAVAQGADIAQACDSATPAPMSPPSYATIRGMERFVDSHTPDAPVPGFDTEVAVELGTVQGMRRRQQGARIVRVPGAWAHDAGNFFSGERLEALPLLPERLGSLLDVGGGEGAFLAAVKAARPAVKTTLVELTADASSMARARPGIDAVHVANFLDWRSEERFDCVSFLDVLEHMPDPEAALRHAMTLLAPNGSVLMSIPNVGHGSVIADLLEGRWDWAPVGIHCFSHLRFFTRHTIERLLQRVGLEPCQWHAVRVPCPPGWAGQWATPALTLDRDSLDTYAYLVRAEVARR